MHSELVDADDDQLFLLDGFLVGIGRILDLLLLEPAGDRLDRAAKLVDLVDVLQGRFFDLVGQRLNQE